MARIPDIIVVNVQDLEAFIAAPEGVIPDQVGAVAMHNCRTVTLIVGEVVKPGEVAYRRDRKWYRNKRDVPQD